MISLFKISSAFQAVQCLWLCGGGGFLDSNMSLHFNAMSKDASLAVLPAHLVKPLNSYFL